MGQLNSVKTDHDGWQVACVDLAKAKQEFAVEGHADKHWEFFDALRVAYGYELQRLEEAILFLPAGLPSENRSLRNG